MPARLAGVPQLNAAGPASHQLTKKQPTPDSAIKHYKYGTFSLCFQDQTKSKTIPKSNPRPQPCLSIDDDGDRRVPQFCSLIRMKLSTDKLDRPFRMMKTRTWSNNNPRAPPMQATTMKMTTVAANMTATAMRRWGV